MFVSPPWSANSVAPTAVTPPSLRAFLALLVAVSGVLLTGPVTPALAADVMNAALTQTTGTAPFSTTEGPGNDTSAADKIVRTNDYVTYHVSISASGGAATTPTITMTLPQGQEMAALPAFCAAGSTLTPPPPAPTPATLTSTTYQSLPQQTLSCIVGTVEPGAGQIFDFTARVRPEMPNNVTMGPVSATITSPDSPTATTGTVQQTVSATSKWDLSINGSRSVQNSAFVKQSTVQRCSIAAIPQNDDGTNQWCFVGGYPLTLSIPDGGKGGVPMAGGDFSFQVDVDPVTIWGQTAVDAAAAQGVMLAGGYLGNKEDSPYGSANSRLSQGTTANSVRDSGTVTTSQPGGAGTPIIVTVDGADTTAYTQPTYAAAPAGERLWDERAYVFTQRVYVEVPVTALMGLDNIPGVDINATQGIIRAPATVEANDLSLQFTGLDGDAPSAYSDADGTANNFRRAAAVIQSIQAVSNHWISPAGEPTATPAAVHNPGYGVWLGPSGPTGKDTGDGVAMLGQTVISSVHVVGDSFLGNTTLICQTFDNTQLQVKAGYSASQAGGPGMQNISPTQYAPYTDTDTGGGTWISGSMVNWLSPQQLATGSGLSGMVDRFGDFVVQYGSGPADDSGCTGAITWSSTPSATTNHVRVFIQNKPGTNALTQRTNIAIAFEVIGGENGDLIPTWTSYTQVPGYTATFDEMLARPASTWVTSAYDPQADNDDTPTIEGRRGDRLTLVGDMARVSTEVLDPATGTYVSTDSWVPHNQTWLPTETVLKFAPGGTVNYRITPTLSSAVPTGTPRTVVVEDCFPVQVVGQNANIFPDYYGEQADVVPLLPFTSDITCDPGEQYAAWIFPNVTDTSPLPVINMSFRVLDTAPSGLRLNETRISAYTPNFQNKVDFSSTDQRSDFARIMVEAPAGISLSKASYTRRVLVDSNGWVSTPSIFWQVQVRAVENPQPMSDVDVIDLLPANGVNSSSFTGSGDFISASVIDNPNVTILYTKSAVDGAVSTWIDPAAASNGPDGSTIWCSSPSGGTVVSGAGTVADCPQAPGEVTALRFLRPGEFGANEVFTVNVYNSAEGSVGGNHMYNRTMARVGGLDVPLTAVARTDFMPTATANFGVINGSVWDDVDADGIWDDGEPVIPGATVTISGTESDGPHEYVTTTRPDGSYTFAALQQGVEYTITFTWPEGYVPTVPRSAGFPAGDSVGDVYQVTLVTIEDQFTDGIDSGFVMPAELAVAKSVTGASGADGAALAGDTLTYTVTATNTSDRLFNDAFPATVVDSLADVLDDGTLIGMPTASTGTVEVVDDQLVWTGALPPAPGGSVTITYTVEVTGQGDGDLTNVAFATDQPIDPDTGLPTDPEGDPVMPPAECAAPACATTTTLVTPPGPTPPGPTPPGPTPPGPTPHAAPGTPPRAILAQTGADAWDNLLLAVGLLTGGAILVSLGRRRRT